MRNVALLALFCASCVGRVPPEETPPLILEPIEPIDIPPPIEIECDGPIALIQPLVGDVHPFETVRLDATESLASDGGPFIGEFEFTLVERPEGSTTALFPDDEPATELELDLPGRYSVQLHVYEIEGDERVRSCEPAVIVVDAQLEDDLVATLTWDHPTADLDLHTLREGGEAFTHEGDVYFSNRGPVGAPWSEEPNENPVLSVDDNQGYGPEMTTVHAPAIGDVWTFAVHYWNAQTDGDPRTDARLRV